jgi:hypothetical protein
VGFTLHIKEMQIDAIAELKQDNMTITGTVAAG